MSLDTYWMIGPLAGIGLSAFGRRAPWLTRPHGKPGKAAAA
jgi:hypothetical protein